MKLLQLHRQNGENTLEWQCKVKKLRVGVFDVVFSWKKVVCLLQAHHWRTQLSTTVCAQRQRQPQRQRRYLTVHRQRMSVDRPLQHHAVLRPVLTAAHQCWLTRLLVVYICPMQCHQAPLAVMRHCLLGKCYAYALWYRLYTTVLITVTLLSLFTWKLAVVYVHKTTSNTMYRLLLFDAAPDHQHVIPYKPSTCHAEVLHFHAQLLNWL